jgi:ABC-type phosphate transport system substrate-binding protein
VKRFLLALAGAALALSPTLNAATSVEIVGAGSSAQWQTAGYAAWHDLAGSGAGHYTVKGAGLLDSRSSTISNGSGNLWIVWNSAQTQVWAYLSVDSVVGNRAYFAQPRAEIVVQSSWESTAGQNLISSALWGGDASALPSAVYNALAGSPSVTAAFTDIRPEDAKFAQSRAVSTLNTTNYSGLGYGTGPNTLVGTDVESAFSSSFAQPVDFNISGTDPFTNKSIPSWTTISVGASPVVFIINKTDSKGLGAGGFTNITDAQAQKIFSGQECDTDALGGTIADVAINPILREPISGTMNTAEFTEFRDKADPNNSQEANVGQPTIGTSSNPLKKTCNSGGGDRYRAIGTGEEVNSGVLGTKDAIGYAFFGYGNFSKIANSPSYGYLKLDGVDPIFSSYSNGELPACTAPCPASPGTSFPNLRNGTYRSWSVLRVATDASGTNNTNVKNLVTAMDNEIDLTVHDFVPFSSSQGGKEPGLLYYRSHYTQSGVAPNNGLGGQKESGGDVGGCIEKVGPPPGVLNCHQ